MALTLNHSRTRQFVDKQLTTAEEDNTINSPLRYDDVVSLYNISSNDDMSKKVKAQPTNQNLISDSSNQLNDFFKPSISHGFLVVGYHLQMVVLRLHTFIFWKLRERSINGHCPPRIQKVGRPRES
ncbi:hypothetical protein ACFE04_021895 [Oxalis oulophora]